MEGTGPFFVTGSYSGGTWDSGSTVSPLSERSSPLPLLSGSKGLVTVPVATAGLTGNSFGLKTPLLCGTEVWRYPISSWWPLWLALHLGGFICGTVLLPPLRGRLRGRTSAPRFRQQAPSPPSQSPLWGLSYSSVVSLPSRPPPLPPPTPTPVPPHLSLVIPPTPGWRNGQTHAEQKAPRFGSPGGAANRGKSRPGAGGRPRSASRGRS